MQDIGRSVTHGICVLQLLGGAHLRDDARIAREAIARQVRALASALRE